MLNESVVKEIIDRSPVQLFFSGKDGGTIEWPYRMNGAHQARQPFVDASEYYILDSAFQHDDIQAPEILEKADQLGVDMIAVVDVEDSATETIESVLDSMEVVDDSSFDGDVMVPLQPPHDECYKALEGVGDWYAVGGVANRPADVKINCAHDVRGVAGQDIHLHGLGWGIVRDNGMVQTIRENPDLVDSVDSQSEYQLAMTKHMDSTWKAGEAENSGRNTAVSAFAAGYLIEAVRRMNPELTKDPLETDVESATEANW